MKPLTDRQRKFAEQNHNLVYSFMNEKGLQEATYYDVIIFGYLRAVQEYCETPDLWKKPFSTIAWKKMIDELISFQRYQSRNNRNAQTVSLCDASVREYGCSKGGCNIAANDDQILRQMEMELLLHTLASELPQRHMRIIRMKLDGDTMRDIAKAEHITFREINRMISDMRDTVLKLCCGKKGEML